MELENLIDAVSSSALENKVLIVNRFKLEDNFVSSKAGVEVETFSSELSNEDIVAV